MAHPATSLHAWQEQARRIEALGFDTLLIWDHFDAQLAPLSALVAAATATTTLRVGTQVLANDFRHPALLAREAATVDQLSGGRLELGIGAGWNAAEYQQAGISFAHGPTRVARLRESVQILKRLWRGGPVSYVGEHYQLDGLTSHLPPAQRPHPPLMIGGARRQVLQEAHEGRERLKVEGSPTLVVPSGEQVSYLGVPTVTLDEQQHARLVSLEPAPWRGDACRELLREILDRAAGRPRAGPPPGHGRGRPGATGAGRSGGHMP